MDDRADSSRRTLTVAPISVYVVDDVPEMRDLIRFGIEDDPAFEDVGEAGDGRSAIAGITEKRPQRSSSTSRCRT
jgi:hypothetical protein